MACVEYPLCEHAYYEALEDKFKILKCRQIDDVCAYSRYCSDLLRVIQTNSCTQCARRGS